MAAFYFKDYYNSIRFQVGGGAKPQYCTIREACPATGCREEKFFDRFKDEKEGMYRAKGGAYWKKVIKGEWGMPRLLEAKKDVVSCEKLRGFANET